MPPQMHRASLWLLVATAVACAQAGRPADEPADASVDAAVSVDGPRPSVTADGGLKLDYVHPPDVTPPRDLRPAPSGLPLPANVPPARRLLEGEARLTGQGTSSCTHQDPPSGNGDRFCVFSKPGAVPNAAEKTSELWVMNVTRASTGEIPACDGSSPACVRLTTNLWTGFALGGPIHPYSHEFFGDTLIFYADATSGPSELHRGPVYAWRPGWARARRISSERAIMCWGHARAAIAHCLDDLGGDVMAPDWVELRAGAIADTDSVMLPSLGRIRPLRTGKIFAWGAGFTDKGDVFAVSSPDPDPAVEVLRVVATAQLGKTAPKEIVRDATSWEISPQGQRIFFYRQETENQKALYVADFPSGENATKLGSDVHDYLVLGAAAGDQGIAFLTAVDKDRNALRLLRDPRMPASAATVFTYEDMLEGVSISPDMRFTAWSDFRFNVRVVRNGDLASCDLNTAPKKDAFSPWFLDSAGLVFWMEDADDSAERRDGYFADPDGCQGKKRFGLGVDFTMPVGDRALVFGDELDDLSARVTLKYATIAGGKQWPAEGPVRIRAEVDNSSVFFVGTKPLLLMFRVAAGGPAEEGTYVFGPTPF